MLLTSTDSRVVGGARGNQGNEGSSSNSDNISRELIEAVDIDVLISSGRKRRRTSTGTTRVNPSSEEEGDGH